MIELDRDAPLPLGRPARRGDALRDRVGALPAGRPACRRRARWATSSGISFHTVRKAYQRLAEEGSSTSGAGAATWSLERQTLSRAERLERGAGVVEDALHKLVGLGLNDDEVDYVVQEGLQFFERPGVRRALVFAVPLIKRGYPSQRTCC